MGDAPQTLYLVVQRWLMAEKEPDTQPDVLAE